MVLASCVRQLRALARNGLLAAGLALLTAPTALASTPLSGATSVSVTDVHSCAIVNGGVKCCGDNQVGQLGDGTTITRSLAVDVEGLGAGPDVAAVAAGYQHTCALVDGGGQCWGRNAEGQLGIGYRSMEFATPQHVAGLGPGSGVTAVAAGQWYTCAVANGGVLCWGDNFYAVGTPTAAPQEIIPAGSGATAVSVGDTHSGAVVDGGVQCWGFGDWGRCP